MELPTGHLEERDHARILLLLLLLLLLLFIMKFLYESWVKY